MSESTDSPSSDDAVSLCSQSAYPGDDELEALETDIMVKWKLDQAPQLDYSPSGQDSQGDRPEAAVKLAESCPAQGAKGDALAPCDSAVRTDALNAALWLQRATQLDAKGELKEAFRCCAAPRPEKRSAALWKLGGSVLDKLGLPVTAETWLRHATRLAESGDTSAAVLFQKVRAKRLYQPLTQDMAVEVTFTSQGRAICTKKAVKKGDVIFSDKPVLLAQTLPTQKLPCCANCAKSLIRPEEIFTPEELQNTMLSKAVKKYWPIRERVACTCGHEVYCSQQCQQEAWENSHRLICTSKNRAMHKLHDVCAKYEILTSSDCSAFEGWWAASFSPLLMAKLWAQIVCNAVRVATDKGRSRPSPQDWALARAPYRRFIAYGSGIKADAFPKMYQLMREIFSDLGGGLSYPITKEEFSGRYLQVACNSQSFSDGENPMSYLCRGLGDECNRGGANSQAKRLLLSLCCHKEHEGDFAGLFPVHACLNHSCANNAVVADGKTADGRPGCHVKAKRDIVAGDEVFNQYIDTSLSRKERRFLLYRSYNFWCQCTRCQFEGDGPGMCTECDAKAEEGKNFPKCSRCKQAWYCSVKCQKKAWKRGHKTICGLEI